MGKTGKRLTALAGAAIAVAALAGCHGSSGTGSAKASALATGSAAAAAKANLAVISAKCGTTTAAGQIAAAKQLFGGKVSRAELWAKCGVPQAKRPVVETQALDAAEKAHLVKGGHAARALFFEETLPKIIEANQA